MGICYNKKGDFLLKNYDFFEDNCNILKEEKRSPRKDRYASDPTFPAV
jgi:hypothetical protein